MKNKKPAGATEPTISLADLAKKGCRKCHGTGISGHLAGTPKTDEAEEQPGRPIACGCTVKNYAKVRNEIARREAERELRSIVRTVTAPWWKRVWWKIVGGPKDKVPA